MSDLVERLADGRHEVAVEQYKDAADLKQSIDREFVLVKFTGTRGGTELGFQLDEQRSELEAADFESQKGHIKLVGELTLDYKKVRCIADIDIENLKGMGHLELIE